MNSDSRRAGSPAAAGLGRLRFQRATNGGGGGRTHIVESFAASPLKLVQPRNHGTAAWAVTSTYGGGLVGGDVIDLQLDLEPRSQAVLMSQASTKVYRSEFPSRQISTARIGEGALLVAVPDRIACFAGSTFVQEQRYELAPGANLVALDWLSAGRVASGERWEFDHYESRIEVRRENRPIFLEAVLLDADHGPLMERMCRFNTLAALVVFGAELNKGAEAAFERIAASPVERSATTLAVASRIGPDGFVFRWAGVDIETIGQRIRETLSFVCDILGDDPFARRW